jgi:hypothetical protein
LSDTNIPVRATEASDSCEGCREVVHTLARIGGATNRVSADALHRSEVALNGDAGAEKYVSTKRFARATIKLKKLLRDVLV